ncbi:hypothetical protein [Actinoplanes sp. NPDC026623]|uniref:hypothetical protein n=1 Tax=Actinoplanes sp. NPDC026623 TaxID=3155610 RepID=UPI0033D3C5F8
MGEDEDILHHNDRTHVSRQIAPDGSGSVVCKRAAGFGGTRRIEPERALTTAGTVTGVGLGLGLGLYIVREPAGGAARLDLRAHPARGRRLGEPTAPGAAPGHRSPATT